KRCTGAAGARFVWLQVRPFGGPVNASVGRTQAVSITGGALQSSPNSWSSQSPTSKIRWQPGEARRLAHDVAKVASVAMEESAHSANQGRLCSVLKLAGTPMLVILVARP